MGFLGGRAWRALAIGRPGERRAAVLRTFARAVGREALRPRDYFEQDWSGEEWTRGGPTSVLAPGVLTTPRPSGATGPSVSCTGPARSTPTTGTATWTAPSAPAATPRPP